MFFLPGIFSVAVMVVLCVELSSAVLVSSVAPPSLIGPLFRTGVFFSCACWRASLGWGFPLPLSPELVLPVSLRVLPLPCSWGLPTHVLPLLWPPWISSFTLGTPSLHRLVTFTLSLWGLEDGALPTLEREGLTTFTGLLGSSMPLHFSPDETEEKPKGLWVEGFCNGIMTESDCGNPEMFVHRKFGKSGRLFWLGWEY